MGQSQLAQLRRPVNEMLMGHGSTLTTREMFQTLIAMLSVESAWCDHLSDLLKKKQKVIIAGDVENLEKMTSEESRLAKQLGEKVHERMQLIRSIPEQQGLDLTEPPRMSHLKPFVPKDLLNTFNSLIRQTEVVAKQIKEINQQNEFLLRASMDYAQGMITMLYRYHGKGMTLYDTRGVAGQHSADTRLLDRKA